ncbi:Lysophospholipase, alpha-beta hydrolase superfamily [Rhodococcus rhodochrous J3]|uniref:Alpha/beta hydrolase n=2 Tax=Rhodococcus rhodochrous TaxID=1829 RepID=A0AA47AC14_RHORH|nr:MULTISPECIES: alpha/beta hydrolase [Rhodococcus]MBF4480486.1 lysophospholipase [Rhodococcus rhodochrous]MDO1483916.1 alpha/beta hydrolase [Rhodococcus rhodochrous]TWH61203.1 alpha-beta hydrolase superfamily lysophospholipase [Rhodococcus rhodochrous J38]UZF45113.1 alpha/beta hydrolase [Rhodococcus rhodochrous]WSE22720.1 lysophospholipase [Rhodococcus sp. PD04]
MIDAVAFTLDGHAGALAARKWVDETPRYVALLCHGYGEHCGRYEYVAARLVADGAAVYAVDHIGHGLSDGERVLIDDFEKVVDDFRLLDLTARREHPDLPVVLVGHSMGGMIAARYAQRYGAELTAVVLSGPVLGRWATVDALLAAEEIPDTPIDPSTLSRDPEVGRAYVADPLVWHGPFERTTVQALKTCIDTITAAGAVDDVPVLWLHGEDDQLVPLDGTATGWSSLAGRGSSSKTYPGARHEVFNETNRDEVLGDVVDFVGTHIHPLEPLED